MDLWGNLKDSSWFSHQLLELKNIAGGGAGMVTISAKSSFLFPVFFPSFLPLKNGSIILRRSDKLSTLHLSKMSSISKWKVSFPKLKLHRKVRLLGCHSEMGELWNCWRIHFTPTPTHFLNNPIINHHLWLWLHFIPFCRENDKSKPICKHITVPFQQWLAIAIPSIQLKYFCVF